MVLNGAPPVVTPVVTADGLTIHLMTGGPGAALTLTLCRQPVLGRARARAYHRLGCVLCATEALAQGVTTVPDLNHAILNLPRFVAARRLLSRTVPEQRTPPEDLAW
jgi:hypothetical protein